MLPSFQFSDIIIQESRVLVFIVIFVSWPNLKGWQYYRTLLKSLLSENSALPLTFNLDRGSQPLQVRFCHLMRLHWGCTMRVFWIQSTDTLVGILDTISSSFPSLSFINWSQLIQVFFRNKANIHEFYVIQLHNDLKLLFTIIMGEGEKAMKIEECSSWQNSPSMIFFLSIT